MIIKYIILKTNAGSAASLEFLVWSYFTRTGSFLGDFYGKFVFSRLTVIKMRAAQICHSAPVNGVGPTAASAVAELPCPAPALPKTLIAHALEIFAICFATFSGYMRAQA